MPEQRLRESVLDFTTYNMISDALDTFPKILQYIKGKTLGAGVRSTASAEHCKEKCRRSALERMTSFCLLLLLLLLL